MSAPRIINSRRDHAGRSGEEYKWQLPATNVGDLHMLIETNFRDNVRPLNVGVTILPGHSTGSMPMRINTRKTGQIWTINAGGAVSFSGVHE